MKRALQTAWNEFLYGGHLQTLGSVAILATVARIFQTPVPWGLPVATYAVSYAIYVYNRLLEIAADRATNPERTAYVAAHRRGLWRAFYLATALAVVVMIITATPAGALFLCIVFAFGLLYTNLFKGLTRVVPGFKSFYVAAAFAVLSFLPFVWSGLNVPYVGVTAFTLWAFWNALIMQIFLDVKDMKSDADQKLRTIPIVLGRRRTFQLLTVLSVLCALPPLVWGLRSSGFPPETAALAIAPLLSLLPFRIAQRGAYDGYLLESGKFISWPVLLIFGRTLTA